jgi:hypothetical protein
LIEAKSVRKTHAAVVGKPFNHRLNAIFGVIGRTLARTVVKEDIKLDLELSDIILQVGQLLVQSFSHNDPSLRGWSLKIFGRGLIFSFRTATSVTYGSKARGSTTSSPKEAMSVRFFSNKSVFFSIFFGAKK